MNGANPFHGINEANCCVNPLADRYALESLQILHRSQALEISRLREENARLNREREEQYITTLKERAEQWQAIAEKIAAYAEALCDSVEYCVDCNIDCCCGRPMTVDHWIAIAKKELGYE